MVRGALMTITLTREEAQQVLDSLIEARSSMQYGGIYDKAAETLRTRLAQPESKVFGWLEIDDISEECFVQLEEKPDWGGEWIPLYTAPQKKEWVGLTDDEYEAMAEQYVTNCYFDTLEYAKAIEAKLKEKNT